MNTILIIGKKKYIGRHFETIENYNEYNVVYLENYSVTEIMFINPQIVIVPDEHYCELGNIVAILRNEKILTLQLMDGILEWRRTWENELNGQKVDGIRNPINQPAFAHKIACLGNRDFKILESWGNFGKCEIVGMPRLKHIQGIRKDFSHLANRKGRILICTAKTPAFTEEQEKIVMESLLDLRDYFITKNDIEVIWRITGNYSKELNITNTLSDLSGQEIHEIIQQVDAVITTPSTTILESMILRTPVALLDYHNTPHYFETAWSISAKVHIEKTVNELLNPPVTKLEYQEFLLNDQLYSQTDATDRLIELINGMLQYSSRIDQLPHSILTNVQSQTLNLKSDIGTYYPDLNWVDKLDYKRLKLELSAARGTIEVLHIKTRNLQNRLDSIPFYNLIKKIIKRIR